MIGQRMSDPKPLFVVSIEFNQDTRFCIVTLSDGSTLSGLTGIRAYVDMHDATHYTIEGIVAPKKPSAATDGMV